MRFWGSIVAAFPGKASTGLAHLRVGLFWRCDPTIAGSSMGSPSRSFSSVFPPSIPAPFFGVVQWDITHRKAFVSIQSVRHTLFAIPTMYFSARVIFRLFPFAFSVSSSIRHCILTPFYGTVSLSHFRSLSSSIVSLPLISLHRI